MSAEPELPVDVARLAQALRDVAAGLRTVDDTPLFLQQRGDVPLFALLLKRTYRIEGGMAVLAPEADQAPLVFEDVPCAKVSMPRVSPFIAVNESFAFKPWTDVIVQARAYAYSPKTTRTTVSLRFGGIEREIVVHGDRRGEWGRAGRPGFSPAEPFEAVPVRWDHAYGGFDKTAWRRGGRRVSSAAQKAWPAAKGALTPYHYPRNPCGSGYLVDLDEESFEGLVIPNLEHPFAALSPERLAVGSVGRWIRGPLPAAWDFQGPTWFPRVAYLGLAPPFERSEGSEPFVPAEVARGWAAKDLTGIPPILHAADPSEVRLEYTQAAAPGMSFPKVAPDERFELRNLHRDKPVHVVSLPGEVPEVEFELEPGKRTLAVAHLSAVVLRVDLDEVELLWSVRAAKPAALSEDNLLAARRVVRWIRPRRRG
jgi:hypothetical protein